jgi:hypothetical protein
MKKVAEKMTSAEALWGVVESPFMDAVRATREAVVEELQDEGLSNRYSVSEVDDWSDEDYSFAFSVNAIEDDEPEIDVRFTLASSNAYEGIDEGEEGWGVNILVDITGADGRIIGGFAPYNYTDKVWTDDADELMERLGYMDESEASFIVVDDLKKLQTEGESTVANTQQKVARILIGGAVYKQAQLQELLQQYETAAGKLNKAVTNANQALMGKKPDQAIKSLSEDAANALKELIETTDTIAGHIGMGGN